MSKSGEILKILSAHEKFYVDNHATITFLFGTGTCLFLGGRPDTYRTEIRYRPILALSLDFVLVTDGFIVQPDPETEMWCGVSDHDGRCTWALNHWKLKIATICFQGLDVIM